MTEYLRVLVKQMVAKIWVTWEVASGLVALAVWLLPKGIERWLEQSRFTNLWSNYGGWVGLALFSFVTVFYAPFLAWQWEHRLRVDINNQLVQLQGEDAERKRRIEKKQEEILDWEKLSKGMQ